MAAEAAAGEGIFQAGEDAFSLPVLDNGATNNIAITSVGNDRANAFGVPMWCCAFGKTPVATNNLDITRDQSVASVNIDIVKVGDRTALAFGRAEATNNVAIDTLQH